MTTWDPAVEDVAAQLKAARQSLGVEAGALPLLRLSSQNEQQAGVLKALKLSEGAQIQVLLCSRGDRGWPRALLRSAPETGSLLSFVTSIVRAKESPSVSKEPGLAEPSQPANSVELDPGSPVGLLLVYDKTREGELVQRFLSELGRHWMERYGRVDPAPYPLAYYDIADETTLTRLQARFPELNTGGKASVALCVFSQGRPTRVVEVRQGLELPATLVRQLSSSRTRHLAESLSPGLQIANTLTIPDALPLSIAQETSVLLSRLHELAQQLWSGSSEDQSSENRLARRNLLNIVELTRSGEGKNRELSAQLKAALADYETEPLILPKDSSLDIIQKQFLGLTNALLE